MNENTRDVCFAFLVLVFFGFCFSQMVSCAKNIDNNRATAEINKNNLK